MRFCYYPNHEHGCEHIKHCPHLGGAALGTLVLAASDNDEHLRMLHGQLDFERQRWSNLCEENQRLVQRVEQLELELKLERQNKFATNQQKNQQDEPEADSGQTPCDSVTEPKKRSLHRAHRLSWPPVNDASVPFCSIRTGPSSKRLGRWPWTT